MKIKPRYVAVGAVAVVLLTTAGSCESDADKVDQNLIKGAEQFEVQRRIVGINGITDAVLFEVEGKCSLEFPDRRLEVICKHGKDDYRKHHVGLADNVTYVSTQVEGVDADEYRTRIILKPENIVPDFDLVTGQRD